MDEKKLAAFLRTLEPGALLRQAALDPKVGIRRVMVEGVPDDIGLGTLELYLAEVAAGSLVHPHFHRSGSEPYYILQGAGVMWLGRPEEKDGRFFCDWKKGRSVKLGSNDILVVGAGEVHCLRNASKTNVLLIAFVCSPNHLISDRFLVENLPPQGG